MKNFAAYPLALASIAALTYSPPARAVGTRTFELSTLDDLSGGDLKGTSVDSLGHVRAGWNLSTISLGEANAVWSALAMADGGVLLGTGNLGKILRVANGQASVFASTGQLAVTSLVRAWNDGVYAATIPNGRVVRVDGAGKTSVFAELPGAKHVWALAYHRKQNALFAATGPEGKLFRIDASGRAEVYFDSDEPHLVSLAIGDDGAIYAGSSGKALLYRVDQPGRAKVLQDFDGDEVKAIATGPGGVLYAISNEYPEPPELPKRSASVQSPPTPSSSPRPKPGKGVLTRFDARGLPEHMLRRDDTSFVSLAVGEDGRPYVGTGVEGRVYTVDDAHTSTLVADTDERQVGSIVLSGAKRFIATGDPPAYHELRGAGGPDAVWTSKVLDAGLRATYGHARWRASGAIEFSARSGNTELPNSTWSEWSAPVAVPGALSAPPARYLQVRARFNRDPNAVLSQLIVPFVTDNLRAIVISVEVQGRGAASKEKELPPSGGEPPPHRSSSKIVWKVDNPDSDALRYRLFYRMEGSRAWLPLSHPDETVTRTDYEWNTSTLPEGPYRVRVEASDENAKPPDRVQRHTLESGLFVVDNTPPVFRALTAQGRTIRAEVVDGVGPIAHLEISIDGQTEWHPYFPKDGIFDEPAEAFELDVSPFLPPGDHMIAVRAFDQAGNYVVRSLLIH